MSAAAAAAASVGRSIGRPPSVGGRAVAPPQVSFHCLPRPLPYPSAGAAPRPASSRWRPRWRRRSCWSLRICRKTCGACGAPAVHRRMCVGGGGAAGKPQALAAAHPCYRGGTAALCRTLGPRSAPANLPPRSHVPLSLHPPCIPAAGRMQTPTCRTRPRSASTPPAPWSPRTGGCATARCERCACSLLLRLVC